MNKEQSFYKWKERCILHLFLTITAICCLMTGVCSKPLVSTSQINFSLGHDHHGPGRDRFLCLLFIPAIRAISHMSLSHIFHSPIAFNETNHLTDSGMLFLLFKIIATVALNISGWRAIIINDYTFKSLITSNFISRSVTQHGFLLAILEVDSVLLWAIMNKTTGE